MYDINLKYVKKGKGFFYIFLAVGILFAFILVGVFIFAGGRNKKLDATTMSRKVEIREHVDDEGTTMYSPAYYYVVDGKQYVCGSNSSSSIRPSTDNKLVYYESSNPGNCVSEYSKSSSYFMLIFLIIPIVFILIAVFGIRNINKRVKAILRLNNNGKLVKNLPYRMVESGTVVNGVPLLKPVVDYTLPSGSTIILYGDTRNDKKHFDADGMVDLLIDENDPTNYFIDFEINRLTGNLPQDYYQGSNNQKNY